MLPSLVGTCTWTDTRGIRWCVKAHPNAVARVTRTPCARLLYDGRRNKAGCYSGLIGRGGPLRWNTRSMKRENGGKVQSAKVARKGDSPEVIFRKFG